MDLTALGVLGLAVFDVLGFVEDDGVELLAAVEVGVASEQGVAGDDKVVFGDKLVELLRGGRIRGGRARAGRG
jgi:hypothetical protein